MKKIFFFMKRNIYFHENNSEKGIYRSLKGGFYGFTLLALSLLKNPFSLFTLLPLNICLISFFFTTFVHKRRKDN